MHREQEMVAIQLTRLDAGCRLENGLIDRRETGRCGSRTCLPRESSLGGRGDAEGATRASPPTHGTAERRLRPAQPKMAAMRSRSLGISIGCPMRRA